MAKANTNAAAAKADPADTTVIDAAKAGAAASGDATGAQDGAGQGGTPPTDAAGAGAAVQLNTDTTAVTPLPLSTPDDPIDTLAGAVSGAEEAVADIVPAARQTLREAVSSAAADAAKAGEHATHGVLNAIEVKLAELRNTIAASESQVAEEYRHVLDWFENLL